MIVQCKNCGREYILAQLVEAGVGEARAYAVLERYLVISSAFRCLSCGAGMFYATVNSLGHQMNQEQIIHDLQNFFYEWETQGLGQNLSVATLERFHSNVIKIVERGVNLN